jgi:hypothetical protein
MDFGDNGDIINNVITALISNPKKSRVNNYYDAIRLFKYYDLPLSMLTGAIINKIIKVRPLSVYQPLFFFNFYEDEIIETDDIVMTPKISKRFIELLEIKLHKIEVEITRMQEITQETIPRTWDILPLSIVLYNKETYIYYDNKYMPYTLYQLHKKAQVIRKYIKTLRFGNSMRDRGANLHNVIPLAKIKTIPVKLPSPLLCKVRSNYRFRDIYYLNRIFTIDYRDQCILIETGEELWCKHELYHNRSSSEEYQIEVNGVIKCKFCDTIFEEKIDSASGFTALGKPNQVQSGNLYQDLDSVFILIESILNSLSKISDENKNTIRNILADYYNKYSIIEKLTLVKTMTSVEIYNIMSDVINRYNLCNKNDSEFNLQANEILNANSLKKYFALAYFYLFADIVFKVAICYELIINAQMPNMYKRYTSLWDISNLDLEKKYNFKYFLERYKQDYLAKYSRKFYITKKSITNSEKINTRTKTSQVLLQNIILTEDIDALTNENEKILAIGHNSMINYAMEVSQSYNKISRTIIKNIYYNNEQSIGIGIKETIVQDYESQGLGVAMASIGLLLADNTNNGIIYENNKLIVQDKLDIDYEVNKEYMDNIKDFIVNKNLIKWNHNDKDIKNMNRGRYLSFISNLSSSFSIGHIFAMKPKKYELTARMNENVFSYGISKNISGEIIAQLYLNKNINIMTDFLNSIKIILSADNRKHVKTMGLGDFILNVPLIKQRKIELTNEYLQEEDARLSTLTLTLTNIIEKADVINIADVVGLKLSSKNADINENDNVMLTKNNYVNNLNALYISWYNLFKYLSACTKYNEPAETMNELSKVKKLKEKFNKLNKVVKPSANILENVSIKNLRTMYSKYKIGKMVIDDTVADSFANFTNVIYRNNLIYTLYHYVIDYIGINHNYSNFIDINGIYSENSANVDAVKECYVSMFEYIYRDNKINNALNETFKLHMEELEMKQIKKMFSYKTPQAVVSIIEQNGDYEEGIADVDASAGAGDVDDVGVVGDVGDMIEELNYEEEQLDGDGNMEEDDYDYDIDATLAFEADINENNNALDADISGEVDTI